MKKILYSSIALLLSTSFVSSQNCDGTRYRLPIFTSVTTTKDVKYGENFKQDGTTVQELFMDVYTPNNDTYTERPVIVFAHGGSFTSGSKDQVASQCTNFAKLGYTAVSIQYRLLELDASVMTDPGTAFLKEVLRAVHDMRAAIRFLRKSVAENNNPYGINPNIVIVGGVSAGGILALHTAYLDKTTEIPAAIQQYAVDQGGLEGNSGNPGYSSVPQMVISFCGGIGDTSWIEAGEQPMFGIHTDDDTTVPNFAGYPNVIISIPVMIYGDSLIAQRATNLNINHLYKGYPTGGHCGYPATEAATLVTEFMYDQLCVKGGIGTEEFNNTLSVNVFPNPASDFINVQFGELTTKTQLEIINTLGQVVMHQEIPAEQLNTQVQLNNLNSGIYMVKLSNLEGKSSVHKVIVK